MAQSVSWMDKVKDYLQADGAVPIVSFLLILILFILFSEARYLLIEIATMLLFYAVLVRMWTAMTPDDSELLKGDFSHGLFLLMSAGAVTIGIITHFVHSDDHDKDEVQRRAGHTSSKTIDTIQTVFDRRPQPLKDYLNERYRRHRVSSPRHPPDSERTR